jgi:predicted nucleic acid-binding protein/GNAT superfamily N-acetyltransferase
MRGRFFISRKFVTIQPFLEAARTQSDSEREALGFLPASAYLEAAKQGKLFVLILGDTTDTHYGGHLLFGGVFPQLRVRQICVVPRYRRQGHATTLIRALKAFGEHEGYLSIVANVASDLESANSFYGRNGFATRRLKQGGTSRNRIINVRTIELQTPNLFTLMSQQTIPTSDLIKPHKKSSEIPLYAIDLNVFFDAIKARPRSEDAGAVFEAALRQKIRIAASDEFIRELEGHSSNAQADPALALAKRIPNLPPQEKNLIQHISIEVAKSIFPERCEKDRLSASDTSDALHVSHAIAAGAAGYITSDSKVLAARDELMRRFGLDVIALSEFVELLDAPGGETAITFRSSKNFRISSPTISEAKTFLQKQNVDAGEFLVANSIANCVSDDAGIIGISSILPSSAIDQPSRSIVCVIQDHPFSSTVAEFLISEQIRICTAKSVCSLTMRDIANHPITRRVALNHGFQPAHNSTLQKIALGYPITRHNWKSTRLAVERLGHLRLEEKHPRYDKALVEIKTPDGSSTSIPLFDLETLLSPSLLILPRRAAVIAPITKDFAGALLGTDDQYSLLEVPEAQFLSRRTYFNTIRAAGVMIRDGAIAFYESRRSKGRGAVVAIARIVEVTSVAIEDIPEIMQRAAVVDEPTKLTKSARVLVTQFDNLLPLKNPVNIEKLREFGCVSKSNLVSASPISAAQLEKIVRAGF